ncbi:MAG: inorganic phosphate transporter [Elusimicrobiota bacterium]
MENNLIFIILIIAVGLIFTFFNGANDSANITATVVSSGVLSLGWAKFIAAIFEFLGACFLGTAVARTIAYKIVMPASVRHLPDTGIIILSAIAGALVWIVFLARKGIPVSSFHSLIGGIIGSFTLSWGINSLQWKNISNIFLVLLLSPFVGFFLSYLVTSVIGFFSRYFTPKVNILCKILQLCTTTLLAFTHGSNDGQKMMGIITFSLIALGFHGWFPLLSDRSITVIPTWVIFSCALSIAFGVGFGQKRILCNVGMRLFRVRIIHGLSAQSSSSLVIMVTGLLGFPLSSTQVISSSIAGTGAVGRPKAIRWHLLGRILFSWLVTMPAAALISGLIYGTLSLLKRIL